MAMGRFPAAKKVVMKFAGNAPEHVIDDIIEEAKRKKAAAQDISRASIADLFSTKVWASRTALFSFELIIYSFVWYHITASTGSVGGNPYVSFTIGASSEYPTRLINVLLIKYCRRRFAICGSMCFAALVMVALWPVPSEYSWLRLGLLMLGKMGTSMQGAVLRVQLSEIYPTVVRSVAMGFCSTVGWLGSVLAPFLDDLGEATQPWVPIVVLAGLCMAGAGASWLLPESFQNTLEDGFSTGEAAVNE
ncbi:organic cation transporter protein [Dermacentor silvarum]|uniref:organic cation transporter protein n=1 Tax=Dermacentor silvarum TaxID=543639 RepID=UPI00189AB66B|nr:organic cation transporter protein [Dermacentor silvarum]